MRKISYLLILLSVLTTITSASVQGTVVLCKDAGNCTSGNSSSYYDHVGSPEPSANDGSGRAPPPANSTVSEPTFWCPGNFYLLTAGRTFYRTCRPLSCVNVSLSEVDSLRNQKAEISPWRSSESNNTVFMCAKFSRNFTSCPKRALSSAQFRQVADGKILNLLDGTLHSVGSHFRRGNEVIVCDALKSAAAVATPEWCVPHQVASNRLQVRANGRAVVAGIDADVAAGNYRIRDGYVDVCFAMMPSFIACVYAEKDSRSTLIEVKAEHLTHFNTTTLTLVTDGSLFYPLGNYILSVDKSSALVCFEKMEEHQFVIFGVLSLVSAIFVLMTLLLHLWIPNLSFHAKPVLCLLVSMLVMYLALSIRSFLLNSRQSGDGFRLAVSFAFQYTSGLASFFWLNVLSLDLWHQYANPTGILNPGSKRGRKRRFIIKCGYAWGIPLLLCAFVLTANFNDSIQSALNLQLHVEQTGWFYDFTSMSVLFYAPIAIILVANTVIFTLTMINVRKWSKGISLVNKKIHRQLLALSARLFLVMGICWFTELISYAFWLRTPHSVWYFTDIVNLLQGFFISLVYVCKRNTINIIRGKFCKSSAGVRRGLNAAQMRRIDTTVSRTQVTKCSSLNQPQDSWKEDGSKNTPSIELSTVAVNTIQDGGIRNE